MVTTDIAGNTAFLTIQDDPFIASCCLLASPGHYRRAEPQQDSFSAAEVGFSLGLLRARPIAARASTGRGTKAVYHKEGIDPGERHPCHILHSQKR